MQFSNDIAGGITLVRPALRSPNYAAGTSGWTVNLDGSAEFNNVTIRGTLQSSNYVAGTSGWKLDQSGTAEINQLTARGTMQSSNYAAGTTGWKIDNGGSAEFNNVTVRGTFAGTNFFVNSNGVFAYSGAPAAGNLIASIAAAGGTDAFGNAYLDGVASYTGGVFTSLAAGSLWIGDVATGYSGAAFVGELGSTGIVASSPTPGGTPDDASWALVSGSTATTPRSAAGYPHFDVGAGTAGVTQWINGAVIKSTVSGGTSTAETWHTPTFSGTWSSTGTLNGNSTFRGMQYRMDAEDNVWICGAATTTGAGGSIFTLPAGYFNSSRRHLLPCFIFDSSAAAVSAGFAQVTEAGVVNIAASLAGVTIAAGDQVFINGKFPVGNVA